MGKCQFVSKQSSRRLFIAQAQRHGMDAGNGMSFRNSAGRPMLRVTWRGGFDQLDDHSVGIAEHKNVDSESRSSVLCRRSRLTEPLLPPVQRTFGHFKR